MSRRFVSGIIILAGAVCIAGVCYFFLVLEPEPLPPARMLPAETAFYVEVRRPDTVIDSIAEMAARFKRTAPRAEARFGDTGTYGRIFEVVSAMTAGPVCAPGAEACAAVDLSEFTYLPAFVVIVNAQDGRSLKRHVRDALDGFSERYLVQSTRSRGWHLSVVAVEEETLVHIGRRGRTIVVSNSPDMYGDVITTAAGDVEPLASDPDFVSARQRVRQQADMFVFARPRETGSNFPIEKVLSMTHGEDMSRIAGKIADALGNERHRVTRIAIAASNP